MDPPTIQRPPDLLPPGRGSSDEMLPSDLFNLPVPSLDPLQQLSLTNALPAAPLPSLDALRNLNLPYIGLPSLDLSPITSLLTATLDKVLALVRGEVNVVVEEAQALDDSTTMMIRAANTCGTRCLPCNAATTSCQVHGFLCVDLNIDCGLPVSVPVMSASLAVDPGTICTQPGVPQGACYTLTWHTSSGSVQQLTLPLCVAAPIGLSLPADTLATVCPIPIAGLDTTSVAVPSFSAGSVSAQLYLSEQKLLNYVPSAADLEISATYTLPSAAGGTATTLFLDLNCGTLCPGGADVGASTNYSPVAATASTQTHVQVLWDVLGAMNSVSVGVVGSADVKAQSLTEAHGVLDLNLDTGSFSASFSNQELPQGIAALPPAEIDVDHFAGSDEQSIAWTALSQAGFTFQLQVSPPSGTEPTDVTYKGTNGGSGSPNQAFTVTLTSQHNGLPTAYLQQNDLGRSFSTDVGLPHDAGGATNGVSVNSSPDTGLSQMVLKDFVGGATADEIEVAGLQPQSSQASITLGGSGASSASAVTVSGTAAPSSIGAMVFRDQNGNVQTQVQTSLLVTQNSPIPLRDAVTAGVLDAATMSGADPWFQLQLTPSGNSGGSASGVAISASTQDPCGCVAQTAGQITLRATVDPASQTVVNFVLNQIAQQSSFSFNSHGTATNPAGFDMSQNNVPSQTAEYKQVYVSRGGSPVVNIQVHRLFSNTSGEIVVGGPVKFVTAQDPPQNFSLSVDAALSASPNVHVTGQDSPNSDGSYPVSALGSLSLGDGAGTSVTLNADYPEGKYNLDITGTPDQSGQLGSAAITVSQSTGDNFAANLEATIAGAGQAALSSFAASTTANITLLRNTSGDVSGATLHASNSDSNPGLGLGVGDSAKGIAFDVVGPTGTPPLSGPSMVVGHNVPEGFVATANRPNDTSVHLAAQNPSPQPSEYFTVDAPVTGGTLHGEVDEMDTNTSIDETMSTTANGTKHFHLQNSNANANSGEAIQEKVTNGSGVVTLALVLAGPTAQGLSVPARDWNFSWVPMPSTFTMDVDFNVANGVYVNVGLTSPQPDSGQLRVDSGDDHKHIVFTGTAASESFTLNAPNTGTNSSHASISGTVNPGMGSIEAYTNLGTPADKYLAVVGGSAPPDPANNNGVDIVLQPNPATAYNETLDVNFDTGTFTYDVQNSAAGTVLDISDWVQPQRVKIDQYNQCVISGTPNLCVHVRFDSIPRAMHLQFDLPGGAASATASSLMDYHASDSNLNVTLDTVNGSGLTALELHGIPSGGMTLSENTDSSNSDLFHALATQAGQTLPSIYAQVLGVTLPPFSKSGTAAFKPDPNTPEEELDVSYDITLAYTAGITIHVDPGLTEVVAAPMKSTTVPGFAVTASGPPSAAAVVNFNNVQLNSSVPGQHVTWSWTFASGQFGGTGNSDDSDSFPISSTASGIPMYEWEARADEQGWQVATTGCSDLNSVPPIVNPHITEDGSQAVPFTPTYVETHNGFAVCGNHTLYLGVNPEDLFLEHCNGSTAFPCAGKSRYSYIFGALQFNSFVIHAFQTSDWIFAGALKDLGSDPNSFSTPPPCVSACPQFTPTITG